MRRSVFFAAALLALFTLDRARADVAPFGCDASAGQTCYFRIYYARGVTRMVQLVAGTKTTVPDVDIGQARYCVAVGKPPPPKCSQKAVNANHNN
jgi:hypothetical protein